MARKNNGRPRETQVQTAIVKYLREAGWLVRRANQIHVPGRTFPKSEEGVSDLLCCAYPHGKFVAIEIKRDAAAHTEWVRQNDPAVASHARAISQKRFGDEVRKRGGYFYCIWSVEQAKKIVEDVS